MKGSPWRLWDGKIGLDRAVDRCLGKLLRQRRRRRRHHVTDGRGSHADRAKIVSLAIVVMALATVGRRDGCDQRSKTAPGALAVDRVNVTEGQAEVDGQRDQRAP